MHNTYEDPRMPIRPLGSFPGARIFLLNRYSSCVVPNVSRSDSQLLCLRPVPVEILTCDIVYSNDLLLSSLAGRSYGNYCVPLWIISSHFDCLQRNLPLLGCLLKVFTTHSSQVV